MKIQNMQFSYKSNQIYKDFTIEFPTASVTAILGPSGCGKTTLLNILAFNKANHVSYIFQEPRLLPWYTICKNLYLVNTGTKSERIARSRMYLEKVGLLNRQAHIHRICQVARDRGFQSQELFLIQALYY